jgi:hypothetical protein
VYRGAPGADDAAAAGLAGGRSAATVRAIIAVPLILGLMALFIFMAINGSGAQSCRPGPAATRTMSCQSAQEPTGHT